MADRYKGRLIDPHPYELADGSGWSAEVYVAEDVDNETIDTQFLVQGVFPTKEAAIHAAIASGRRVVDKAAESHEIQSIIKAETQLPSTYRHGLGRVTDDVASAPGRGPVKVSGPDNPEDLYK
jgi:hypothetical protein